MEGNLNIMQATSQQVFKVTTVCMVTLPVFFASDPSHRPPTSQQVFKVTTVCMVTLPVFFASDLSHRPSYSAEIQSMSQQASTATGPYRGLVLDTRLHHAADAVIYRI